MALPVHLENSRHAYELVFLGQDGEDEEKPLMLLSIERIGTGEQIDILTSRTDSRRHLELTSWKVTQVVHQAFEETTSWGDARFVDFYIQKTILVLEKAG